MGRKCNHCFDIASCKALNRYRINKLLVMKKHLSAGQLILLLNVYKGGQAAVITENIQVLIDCNYIYRDKELFVVSEEGARRVLRAKEDSV